MWVMAIVASIIVSNLGKYAVGLLHNDTLLKLYDQTILRYLWLFLLGMAGACFSEKLISLCKKWWFVFPCIWIILKTSDFDFSARYDVLKTVCVFLTAIGFSYQFPQLKLKRDISFGIYIYHMTVVNIMITFGFTGKLIYLFIAVVISCVLAYLSTITIGNNSAKKSRAQPVKFQLTRTDA